MLLYAIKNERLINYKFIFPWILKSLPYILVIIIFCLSHLPSFIEFPLPVFRIDWSGYYKIIANFLSGDLPGEELLKRGPGYPAFVSVFHSLGVSYHAIMMLQSILLLGACIFAIFVSAHLGVITKWLTSIAFSGYIGHQWAVRVNTMMLPDSLFASLQIISVSVLLLGFINRDSKFLMIGSVFCGLTVIVKAGAIYLLVLLLICSSLWALLYKSEIKKGLIGLRRLLVPFSIIYMSMYTYNLVINGVFTANVMGTVTLAMRTVHLWEPSTQYDEKINSLIKTTHNRLYNCSELHSSCQLSLNERDDLLMLLKESWNPQELDRAASKLHPNYNIIMKEFLIPLAKHKHPEESRWAGISLISNDVYKLSIDSIARNTKIYLKMVIGAMYRVFFNFYWKHSKGSESGFYYTPADLETQLKRYNDFNGRGWFEKNPVQAIGNLALPFNRQMLMERIENLRNLGTKSFFFTRLYNFYFERIHHPIFDHRFLGCLIFLSFVVAAVALFVQLHISDIVIALLLVSCAGIGGGMVTALVQNGGMRDAASGLPFQLWSISLLLSWISINFIANRNRWMNVQSWSRAGKHSHEDEPRDTPGMVIVSAIK